MKILQVKSGFTVGIFPGRFCYNIELNDYGANLNVGDIIKQAIHFPRIVISGDEPFTQKEDIATLIRKIKAQNTLAEFDIHTTAKIRPVKIGNVENVNYIVHVDTINSKVFSEDNTDHQTITWFITMGAHFLFPVQDEDDVDRVSFIAREYNISKAKIYLCSDDVGFLVTKSKIIGCNYMVRGKR